ncbi:MAG: membrane protein insertion efficiency factor YidD [Acidobacteria bacterium]|nr:membrane protein insertion efficiency factor YidD [Acidobacteriota bacterium]
MRPFPALKPITAPPSNAEGARWRRRGLSAVAAAAVLAALKAYKLLISPLFTGCCRFYPSCADYTREAVLLHGAARGLWLGSRRLARCHPLGGHGVDPVPYGGAHSRSPQG